MTLDEARRALGKTVIYRPPGQSPELGMITSVNDHFVFVRYGEDKGAKATLPTDLGVLW